MTPSGIEAATFRFVAQYLNHCATAVPLSFHTTLQIFDSSAVVRIDENIFVNTSNDSSSPILLFEKRHNKKKIFTFFECMQKVTFTFILDNVPLYTT
jgi:hypothetical protein